MVQDMAMNRYQKRERTQNWSNEEKRFLLDLVKRDMGIIENKRLDADLTSLKNRAWKIIHMEFSKSYGNERNCNRLKEQWRRMKAVTRTEIIDYNHRVANFGIEVADQKRPSPFTMQVWAFMQESKLACSKDAVEKDYSKVRLELEDLVPEGFQFESDDDASSSWQNDSLNLSHVKEESTDSTPNIKRSFAQAFNDSSSTYLPNGGSDDQPASGLNDVSTHLDALNMLKNGLLASAMANANGGGNTFNAMPSPPIGAQQLILDMQNKEHQLRMEVLQQQLDTARFNREAAEINKMIALRNLTVLSTIQSDDNHMNSNGNGHISS